MLVLDLLVLTGTLVLTRLGWGLFILLLLLFLIIGLVLVFSGTLRTLLRVFLLPCITSVVMYLPLTVLVLDLPREGFR